MSDKNKLESKIEYYFLRNSAERFASDLNHFSSEICNFSDEQLYAIISFSDLIKDNIVNAKVELEKRLEKTKKS